MPSHKTGEGDSSHIPQDPSRRRRRHCRRRIPILSNSPHEQRTTIIKQQRAKPLIPLLQRCLDIYIPAAHDTKLIRASPRSRSAAASDNNGDNDKVYIATSVADTNLMASHTWFCAFPSLRFYRSAASLQMPSRLWRGCKIETIAVSRLSKISCITLLRAAHWA